MVETHFCSNIKDCREQARNKFAKQLVDSKCIAVKVDKI